MNNTLTKYKLGDLIIQRREKYNGEKNFSILGVSREGFIKPKQKDVDISKYNTFYKYDFVFNPARMEINSIALNTKYNKAICSSLYEIFYIRNTNIILPEYLNLFIKRNEFARQCEFIGWGSAREYCRVGDISDIDIELPPVSIQQKYVDIYKSMLENQKCYETALDDLKLVCDAYIEDLRRKYPSQKIGQYITRRDERNKDNSIKNVMGISVTKEFRLPTSKVKKDELSFYKIVRPNDIAFVQTTHNEKVFAFACNLTNNNIVVSSVNEVFFTDTKYLLPEYISLYFMRKEFDRYARFHSWGSARETFTWKDVQNVEIPIPDIEIQRSVADIYKVYMERKQINEQLKTQIKNICPILIRGAIEETKKQ